MCPIGPLEVRRGLLQHDNLCSRGPGPIHGPSTGGLRRTVLLRKPRHAGAITSTGRFSGRVILKGAILPALDRGKEGLMMHLPLLRQSRFQPYIDPVALDPRARDGDGRGIRGLHREPGSVEGGGHTPVKGARDAGYEHDRLNCSRPRLAVWYQSLGSACRILCEATISQGTKPTQSWQAGKTRANHSLLRSSICTPVYTAGETTRVTIPRLLPASVPGKNAYPNSRRPWSP
jgi:hypothetical protein